MSKMQLKTTVNRHQIAKYCKYIQFQLKIKNKNLIDDIFNSLKKDHHLALGFDDQENLVFACFCNIRYDFFNNKICDILDFFINENFENSRNINEIFNWIENLTSQYLCHKILYSCLTNNQQNHRIFTANKFIIEKFVLSKDLLNQENVH